MHHCKEYRVIHSMVTEKTMMHITIVKSVPVWFMRCAENKGRLVNAEFHLGLLICMSSRPIVLILQNSQCTLNGPNRPVINAASSPLFFFCLRFSPLLISSFIQSVRVVGIIRSLLNRNGSRFPLSHVRRLCLFIRLLTTTAVAAGSVFAAGTLGAVTTLF